jgi:hypothetical protein
MPAAALSSTRRALHGVAELVLAGPQYRRSGTIRLRPQPGGFGTIAEPDIRVDGARLIAERLKVPLNGITIAELAARAGVDVGAPGGVYETGSGADPDDVIDVDADAAAALAHCYAIGDAALRILAPAEVPVLWPEHFDLGVTIDEVNYGVSPGDTWLDEPYAYVGPWRLREGAFWTVPFGAAHPLRDLPDVAALVAFLAEGRERAGRDPVASGPDRSAWLRR